MKSAFTMEYPRGASLFVNVFTFTWMVFIWILPAISCLQPAQINPDIRSIHHQAHYDYPTPDNRDSSTKHKPTYSRASGLLNKLPSALYSPTRHSTPQSASQKAGYNQLQYSSEHMKRQHGRSDVLRRNHRKHSIDVHIGGSRDNGAQSSLLSVLKTVPMTGNIENKLDMKLHFSPVNKVHDLQLAVKDYRQEQGQGQMEVHDVMLMVGSALAALFSLGVIFGIFGCCCRKRASEDNLSKEENGKVTSQSGEQENKDDRTLLETQKPSQIFNTSDIPPGEKDLDEISFKEKIKVLEGSKLIIQPTPEKRKSQLAPDQTANRLSQVMSDQQTKRLSQHVPDQSGSKRSSQVVDDFENSATVQIRVAKQPKVLVSDDEAEARDKSRSSVDIMSKSDTQDDISDKIFDDVSMNSSISMPHNPDVVVADTDDEDEFAELQRGTVILKSFQRAKPPRNRSPATRTSKGKIRKPRPSPAPRKQSDTQEVANVTETVSTAPESSLTAAPGCSKPEKTEPEAVKLKQKSNSLDKSAVQSSGQSEETAKAMSKSMDFSDFDSVMNKSITSIGSDIVTPMKRERNGKYAKSKDSPKRERKESPARFNKSNGSEISEKEKRTESPSRYKKNSPVNKRKNRRRENDKQQNRLSSDISEDKPVENESVANRLSGLPANASNNIFFLIDPTVKNKYKSVGDIVDDKRKSGDFSAKAQKPKVANGGQDEAASVRRERTYSDPNRKSGEIDSSHV